MTENDITNLLEDILFLNAETPVDELAHKIVTSLVENKIIEQPVTARDIFEGKENA